MVDYRWYAAQALAGLESTAIHHLSREGITAWSPQPEPNRPGRLFPGYVFVELETPDDAGVVNRTRGVHKLLPVHASTPLPLPHRFVENLRALIEQGSFTDRAVAETVYKFVEHDEIVIDGGPWDGHTGEFLRYHKNCSIVLLACFGSKRELPIPRDVRLLPSGRGTRSVGDLVAA